MSDHRRIKVGDPYYDYLTVFEFDGVTPVSGQLPGDFAVDFVYKGTPASLTHTIAEIGTSGDYLLTIPDGFPSKGTWAVTVEVAYNGSTWRSVVEVSVHDVDDVYDVIVAGGTGVENVTFTVVDTANGDAPIPDALIQVYDDTGTVLVTFQRTDTSGEATVLLDADDYVIRIFKPGLSYTEETITVADTGGATPQSFTLEAESINVLPPPSPDLCRLYGDFVLMSGLPMPNLKVQVQNLYDPEADAGLMMLQGFEEHETDDVGHVEFDIVRGSRVRIAFVSTSLSRDITVPDKPVENLTTVFGQATDNFMVVAS
jgi:hypothetical protein